MRYPLERYNPREDRRRPFVSAACNAGTSTLCSRPWPVMELQVVILLATLCFVLCISKRLFQSDLLARIPGPTGHYIYGNLRDLLRRDYHKRLAAWSREYGPIYRISVMGVQGLVVAEPRIITSILGRDRDFRAVPKLKAYQELDMVIVLHEKLLSCMCMGRAC